MSSLSETNFADDQRATTTAQRGNTRVDSSADTARVRLSPYVVFRRGTLPLSVLAPFKFDRFWSKVDKLQVRQRETADASIEIHEQLSTLVPSIDDVDLRRAVIQIRRDVHNLRAVAVSRRLPPIANDLDPELLARLRSWAADGELAVTRHDEAIAEFEAQRQCCGEQLATVFNEDVIGKSIQLSGRELFHGLQSHLSGTGRRLKPSKTRILESTLINFAFRSALKPSPFGRFTVVGAFDPTTPTPAPSEQLESTATTSRVLLNWLTGALQRAPGGQACGAFLLNSSTQVHDTVVRFIGVRADPQNDNGYGGREAVVALKRSPLVDLVLTATEVGPVNAEELIGRVVTDIGDIVKAQQVIGALVRCGLLYFRAGLDEQDPHYTQKLGDVISGGQTEEAQRMASAHAQLARLEELFATAGIRERDQLLDAADDAIREVAAICSVPVPPESVVRSSVFEDAWTRGGPVSWCPDSIDGKEQQLLALARLSSLLDYGQVKRLGLYDFFCDEFPDKDRVSFLDFFDQFTKLSETEQEEVLAGYRSDRARTFGSARADACRRLVGCLKQEKDSLLSLSSQDILRVCDDVPKVEPGSVTFRLQFDASAQVVINGVLTGHGVYFSRFAAYLPASDSGWSLSSAIQDHLEGTGQVDLDAVLGFNFNLHPRLTKTSVSYPGSTMSVHTAEDTYALSDLGLRRDDQNSQLRLVDQHGRDLRFVPMNFLIPVGVPALYKVLEALSPTTRYNWHPLADIHHLAGLPLDESHVPRVVVDDVVVERESWQFNADAVPRLDELTKHDPEALIEFDAWRRAAGLPQHAFVVSQTEAERDVLTGRDSGAARSRQELEHLHKASVHKPMYVDFRNPYLVGGLAKSLRSRDGVVANVRECLPEVTLYDDGAHPAAEEFFIELDWDN